jgi:hypothetical protein
VDYFISRCQEVYFATEDYSDATFIIANFGLYGIFVEYGFCEKEPATREEYQRYVQVCKDNLEAALANLNLLMPVTMESVVALTVGVSSRMCSSHTSLEQSLTSAGNSWDRNFKAISQLDSCVNSYSHVPNLGL